MLGPVGGEARVADEEDDLQWRFFIYKTHFYI